MSTAPTQSYPLLPLRKTVIFPGGDTRLNIGRERSLCAVDAALKSNRMLVVSTQYNGEDEDPLPEGLNKIGTLVRLIANESKPDGTMQIFVMGVARVSIQRVFPSEGCYVADVKLVEQMAHHSAIESVLQQQVVELSLQYAETVGKYPEDITAQISTFSSPDEIADYLADLFLRDWKERQRFLDATHPADRFEMLAAVLGGDSSISDLESSIRTRVRQQIEKSQREYYLREQLKVIYDELSGEGGNEFQVLRSRIDATSLPTEVSDKAHREVGRLERLPSTSPEGGVIRTYLDWILSLPWASATEDRNDIALAESILNEDHYGLEKIKERITEFLAVRELTLRNGSQSRAPILLLVGPPGVGKTSLAQSIARALGRRFVRISLGGVRDEAEIRGHRRTYVGALPGRILHGLRQAETSNPVMLLDEIDKMSSDYRGDPSSAMLEVLDPEQNSRFADHYLEMPFDLSRVLFVATANTLEGIPRPLLDRMEVVHIGSYTPDEKVEIARRYLLPKQIRAHGLDHGHLDISNRVLHAVVRFYTRESGVRELERQLGAICRKAARQFAAGRLTRIRVTPHLLEEYLGPPRKSNSRIVQTDTVGVATGMAWTEMGGALLPVEVAVLPGNGKLVITGRPGEVMQESAKAALSFARSQAQFLGFPTNFQQEADCHIHLPEGAVPKDGPSAGITMALCLISALTSRPIRRDIAMTGEITLRGRVLPIGGLKEKVIAAHQAGIKQIIAPIENKPDLVHIPRNVQRELTFHWVECMQEVLDIAMVPAKEGTRDTPYIHQQATYDVPIQASSGAVGK